MQFVGFGSVCKIAVSLALPRELRGAELVCRSPARPAFGSQSAVLTTLASPLRASRRGHLGEARAGVERPLASPRAVVCGGGPITRLKPVWPLGDSEIAFTGYCKPFNPQSVRAMIEGPQPR